MVAPRYLDANVLILFYVGQNDTNPVNRRKAAVAAQLFERIENGGETVFIPLPVLFEVVFTLQRRFHESKDRVRQRLRDLLSLPNVQIANKRAFLSALDLYVTRGLSIVDAMIVVDMRQRKATELYSWDTDFDNIPGLIRVDL